MNPSVEQAGRYAEHWLRTQKLEAKVILVVLREAQPHRPNSGSTPPSILWHFLSILKGSSIEKGGGGPWGTQTSGRGKLKQR